MNIQLPDYWALSTSDTSGDQKDKGLAMLDPTQQSVERPLHSVLRTGDEVLSTSEEMLRILQDQACE